MDKFLKIKLDHLQFNIKTHPDAPIVKNPIPVLWNYKGSYYWIPVEIIKNEIASPDNKHNIAIISLQQAYPLRQDVGKILENL